MGDSTGGSGPAQAPGSTPRITLVVATAVPHDPHMAVHVLEHQPEDRGHLVVHPRGGPARLWEHLTALQSWASTVTGADVRVDDHPATRPSNTLTLSVDQQAPGHPDIKWHYAARNAGSLSPTEYFCVPEPWGHTSSDALGGRPCRHAPSVAFAADLARTRAVAIPGTVPDGEGLVNSLPLQYGVQRPWVNAVDAEVIPHLLRHTDHERTTGVPAGAVKAVNQMSLKWLRNSPPVRRQHTEHSFWFARATSHHSDALLHKADCTASHDTVLQNTPPGPGQAQLIVAGSDGHLELLPPTMRTLGAVALQAKLGHTSTYQGHTPLGTAHATVYVHTRNLTAAASNHRALRARDGHTPVERRLRIRKERLSGVLHL